MSRAGRELGYRHWDRDALVKALMQAEDDIKALQGELKEVQEEAERYHREERDGARIIGGILRVLIDNGRIEGTVSGEVLDNIPDRAPALEAAARRPRRFSRVEEPWGGHRYVGANGIHEVCACGQQWLTQAERCVSQPVKL